jgi:hypothetical protein
MTFESRPWAADRSAEIGWWTPRLAAPVIAAAVVRLALLAFLLVRIGPGALLHADTSSYLIPGRNLLLHGSFMADGAPDLMRPPGYPIFLAITSLAGVPAAAVANVILSVFSVILVWRLGRMVFDDPKIALGAAWIFAFEPASVSLATTLLSETLFLLFLLLSLERMTVFLRELHLPALAVAGLWLAAAIFVRPVSYYLPFALAGGLFLVLARVPGLRWKAPAVLLIGVLPWLGAWQVRNWLETGYSGFSSISEVNLYYLSAATMTAKLDHRPVRDVVAEFGFIDFTNNSGQVYLQPAYLAQHPEQASWNQAQRLAYLHSNAVHIILAHPYVYLRMCFPEMLKTVFYPSSYGLSRPKFSGTPTYAAVIADQGLAAWRLILARAQVHPGVMAENTIFWLLLQGLYLLAVRGLLRGQAHTACRWLLLGTSLYFLVILVASPLSSSRFRMPVMPFVCIFAAAGLQSKNATVASSSNTPRADLRPC